MRAGRFPRHAALLTGLFAFCHCSRAPSPCDGKCGDAGSSDGPDGGPADAGPSDGGDVCYCPALSVSGGPSAGLGIFDPSVVYPVGADAGLMTYSAVAPDQAHVHTRIAASSDHGETWTYVADVNGNPDAGITVSDTSVCGQTTCSGTIVHEVSSLVVDPSDTPDRLLKVFVHTYFVDADGGLHMSIGHIGLETAPGADGPWSDTPLLGWNSPSTFSSEGVAQNVSTDPALTALNRCGALTEPGGLLRTASDGGTVIDLAIACAKPEDGGVVFDIELLRSLDHAQTFTYAATLLAAADATALGALPAAGLPAAINAPDLFEIGSAPYLFITPGGPVAFPTGVASGYRGCVAVPIADLDSGTIARDGGAPVVAAAYLGGAQQFVGACTAAEGAPAMGVAGDVLDFSQGTPFNIFESNRPAP